MFDHFPHTLEYPCLSHPSQNATHICIDPSCSSSSLLCPICLSQFRSSPHSPHQQNILPLFQGFNSISQQIQQRKYQLQKLFPSNSSTNPRSPISNNKLDLDSLIKKYQDNDLTLRSLDSHLRSIKAQIQKDSDALLIEFQKKLQANKQTLFNEVDAYQKNYILSFETFRELIEPVALFKKTAKYYSNVNNVCLKMHNQLKRRSVEWLTGVKKLMGQVYKVTLDKGFGEGLLGKLGGGGGEEFPQYKSVEITESTKMRIQYFINESINDRLNLKGMKVVSDAGMQEEYRGSNNHRIQKRFY